MPLCKAEPIATPEHFVLLNSLIISRIDQLEKTDKQVLQNASVIGKKFYYDTLETLEQKLDESSNIREPVNELLEQSFLMK